MAGKFQNRAKKTATGKKVYDAPTEWVTLLKSAVNDPGIISKCYSAFHNYSIGNAMLAAFQMADRGLPFGPLASYSRWQELGRQVRKGETALVMLQPRTYKLTEEKDGEEVERQFRRYIYLPTCFTFSQTDPIEGKEDRSSSLNVSPETWNRALALAALEITEAPYTDINGNKQGYSVPANRTVHINPVAENPHKTLAHEIAHVLLHQDGYIGCERGIAEVEAEAVAMIVCDALGWGGAAESRGYIQAWLSRSSADEIGEREAGRIFSTAEAILKAGRPAKEQPARQAAA